MEGSERATGPASGCGAADAAGPLLHAAGKAAKWSQKLERTGREDRAGPSCVDMVTTMSQPLPGVGVFELLLDAQGVVAPKLHKDIVTSLLDAGWRLAEELGCTADVRRVEEPSFGRACLAVGLRCAEDLGFA